MIPTRNFSSRLGERVRLLAIHDTEGARTVQSLGAYFQRINYASYHGAVDDSVYESFVNYSDAAWHMLNANQESDSLALCGFAAWTKQEWLKRTRMLDLCAAWLAERSKTRNIPLVHLNYQQIRDCMRDRNHPGGVVMHRDYTYATRDGTHTDLGANFPLDDVVLPRACQLAGLVKKKKKKKEIMVDNYRVHGTGTTPFIIPVGSKSSITDKAWINVVVDGPNPGQVHFFAQDDDSGIDDKEFDIGFRDGRSDRVGWLLPDGTTQVRVEHRFDGWGTIALEIKPK